MWPMMMWRLCAHVQKRHVAARALWRAPGTASRDRGKGCAAAVQVLLLQRGLGQAAAQPGGAAASSTNAATPNTDEEAEEAAAAAAAAAERFRVARAEFHDVLREMAVHPSMAGELRRIREDHELDTEGMDTEDMRMIADSLVESDDPEEVALAVRLYHRGKERGDTNCAYSFASCTAQGVGTEKDSAAAAAMLEDLVANTDLAQAKYALAQMLNRGEGVAKENPDRAFALYLQALRGGVIQALHDCAVMLAQGRGMHKDVARAVDMLDWASKLGDVLSKYTLANWYYRGAFVEKQDQEKAFALQREAAAAGFAPAMFNVAMHYLEGAGTRRNLHMATHFFRLAGETGMAEAKVNLANMYLTGTGVPKDEEVAERLLEEALEMKPAVRESIERLHEQVDAQLAATAGADAAAAAAAEPEEEGGGEKVTLVHPYQGDDLDEAQSHNR